IHIQFIFYESKEKTLFLVLSKKKAHKLNGRSGYRRLLFTYHLTLGIFLTYCTFGEEKELFILYKSVL
ncbi:hypothetical protein, partial [Peribacillus butanolivorans]